jgi:hypothetical protein
MGPWPRSVSAIAGVTSYSRWCEKNSSFGNGEESTKAPSSQAREGEILPGCISSLQGISRHGYGSALKDPTIEPGG